MSVGGASKPLTRAQARLLAKLTTRFQDIRDLGEQIGPALELVRRERAEPSRVMGAYWLKRPTAAWREQQAAQRAKDILMRLL